MWSPSPVSVSLMHNPTVPHNPFNLNSSNTNTNRNNGNRRRKRRFSDMSIEDSIVISSQTQQSSSQSSSAASMPPSKRLRTNDMKAHQTRNGIINSNSNDSNHGLLGTSTTNQSCVSTHNQSSIHQTTQELPSQPVATHPSAAFGSQFPFNHSLKHASAHHNTAAGVPPTSQPLQSAASASSPHHIFNRNNCNSAMNQASFDTPPRWTESGFTLNTKSRQNERWRDSIKTALKTNRKSELAEVRKRLSTARGPGKHHLNSRLQHLLTMEREGMGISEDIPTMGDLNQSDDELMDEL